VSWSAPTAKKTAEAKNTPRTKDFMNVSRADGSTTRKPASHAHDLVVKVFKGNLKSIDDDQQSRNFKP
jgi:hypothetical protein